MKKIALFSEAIVCSIISILINSLVFLFFYFSLVHAEYRSMSFSFAIIVLFVIGNIAFVVLTNLQSLRKNILYLTFNCSFNLALAIFILIVIGNIDSNSFYWFAAILNLIFAIWGGVLIWQHLQLLKD